MPPSCNRQRDYGYCHESTSSENYPSTSRSDARSSMFPVHPRLDPHHNTTFPSSRKDPRVKSPEKRMSRWRATCSIKVQERLARVMVQRFFMVDRTRVGTDLHEEFQVLGSTGNIYTVVVNQMPSCTCPDWLKGNICKHLLFVFIKVLGVPISSQLYYQPALLTNELEDIFSAAPEAPNDPTSQHLRSVYAAATGKAPVDAALEVPSRRKPIEEGDDCPICYEELPCDSTKDIVFCEDGCGKGLHAECHQQYANNLKGQRKPVICVYCRADWKAPESNAVAGTKITEDGYLNMAAAAGIPEAAPYVSPSDYYWMYPELGLDPPRRGRSYYH
ncbi:uncharacterized protein MELLADRAFT_117636 [Melampsora larici-populina 98AG31]|uniref:SWIM-type domain-containing protein n=1 Tax=Melampsora larici-populina (strain 98AG31 / pathotype 3-4-7) TaxID=747676 RepID=F4RZV0_MELLP|nr:uncharacterized protein MELLADRAFT_117636 [Melampsora larici-populina 98AG31]EGG02123.1 hypothetical protein MELLADRAFT_117636 [Melampsora larici-populina 98AG31]